MHAAYALPEPAHSGVLAATTNGLASGNTREEALLHGLMEVIERFDGRGIPDGLAGGSIPAAIRWPCIALGAGSTAAGMALAPNFDDSVEPIPGQTPHATLSSMPTTIRPMTGTSISGPSQAASVFPVPVAA